MNDLRAATAAYLATQGFPIGHDLITAAQTTPFGPLLELTWDTAESAVTAAAALGTRATALTDPHGRIAAAELFDTLLCAQTADAAEKLTARLIDAICDSADRVLTYRRPS